NLED
ncbi:hypothetical protein L6164_022556, partial [Bauhinia variegata]